LLNAIFFLENLQDKEFEVFILPQDSLDAKMMASVGSKANPQIFHFTIPQFMGPKDLLLKCWYQTLQNTFVCDWLSSFDGMMTTYSVLGGGHNIIATLYR